MLQQHLSDQQVYGQLRSVLYERLDGNFLLFFVVIFGERGWPRIHYDVMISKYSPQYWFFVWWDYRSPADNYNAPVIQKLDFFVVNKSRSFAIQDNPTVDKWQS